jgi:hypothetical protein
MWRTAAAVVLAALVSTLLFPQVILKLRGIDRVLSTEPLIEQIDAFISPAQCQALKAIVERRGGNWIPYDESIGLTAESKYLLPLEVDEEPLLRCDVSYCP